MNISIEQYWRDGFVVIDDVFPASMMDHYRNIAVEIIRKRTLNDREWGVHILDVCADYPELLTLVYNPQILNFLSKILGPNIELQHSKVAFKSPKSSAETNIKWHQDFAFFPHTNTSLAAVAIALSDLTPENGAMEVIRGSHQHGLLSHRNSEGIFVDQCFPNVLDEQEKLSFITPKKGGISIHHCLSVHRSGANLTNEPRIMIVFEYRACDAFQLADKIWRDTGLLACGYKSDEVRLEATSFSLPRTLRYGSDYPLGSAYQQIGKFAQEQNQRLKSQ